MVYSAFLFLEYFLFLCVSVQLVHVVCMPVLHVDKVCMSAPCACSALRGQKKASYILELES